jgi:elongation factor G
MQETSYRETIRRSAEAQFVLKKALGNGRGEFAKVVIRLEPLARGAGMEFVNAASALRAEDVAGAESGIREAAQTGVLYGYPGHPGDPA